MTPERWDRIKALFEAALEKEPGERAAFLSGACGSDDDLRAAVLKLLVHHEPAHDFLEKPPMPVPDFALPSRPHGSVFTSEQVVAGRFRILKTLGQGGMGEVYEAFDLELKDSVALKTIRHDIASDARFIARFKQEVQRSRTVSHPNVCRVYDLFQERVAGEADIWFLTMELLRGETLSDRMRREGPFASTAAFPIVQQMCDALDAAHRSGVVHRDFKSGNVMLVAGSGDAGIRAVVTDFGLARPIATADTPTASLDSLGGAIGTPAYMAPEQVEGKAATAASDIYALGVVMYEMVTGTRPFVADSALSVAVLRLTESPVPPRAHVPTLQPLWEHTILRCLERDPAARFTSAGHVSRTLDGSLPATGITTPDRFAGTNERTRLRRGPFLMSAIGVVVAVALVLNVFSGRALAVSSIAVVPFATDGSDPDSEYLSDGVTEGITDSLAQLPQPALKVIALSSMMRFKGRDIDAKAVGDELSVGAVVIGRITQRSEKLSISAELVNANDRSRMWGKTYSVGLADLPAVQGEIAETISGHLRVRLNGDQKTRFARRHPVDVDAYRLYLKGRYFWGKYSEEGWTQAIQYFKQAIEIDPTYALAWSGLADSYYQLSSLVLIPAEAMPLARAAAAKALAIDEEVAEAHASLGIIKSHYDWDAKGAEAAFKRALELNPNYAIAHQWYGMHLFANARFEAALVEFDKARELDPLSLYVAVTAVWPLRHLGREDEAIGQIERIIEMFPGIPDLVAYFDEVRGERYLQKGMNDEAVAELLKGFRTLALCGNDPETIELLKRAYETSGLDGYWQKQLELAIPRYQQQLELNRQQSSRRFVSPFRLAELHARLGHNERAFALLQESYDSRDENLRWLKVDSLMAGSAWQNLRSDPRFIALLRGLGLDG